MNDIDPPAGNISKGGKVPFRREPACLEAPHLAWRILLRADEVIERKGARSSRGGMAARGACGTRDQQARVAILTQGGVLLAAKNRPEIARVPRDRRF